MEESRFYGYLLLAAMENPEFRQQAYRLICDSGNIVLHMHARMIRVKKPNWREIERQCKQQTKELSRITTWDYWTEYDEE